MLLTKNLIENVEEKYIPMLKTVNIPDFYKCISVFSGYTMEEIDDNTIKEYLLTWAKNKYRFYQLLGNKTHLDTPFKYERNIEEKNALDVYGLGKEFPAYSAWLIFFRGAKKNKLTRNMFDYRLLDILEDFFPKYKIEGSTITHFFSMLKAPEELITKIAASFENDIVEATHTISIDPVDMMLASENPYDWTSCYRLETINNESHADGCMAALLDNSSLITYIWNTEGEFKLDNRYLFKSIRYKRMRQWIAISTQMHTIHFNDIYPGRNNYNDDFEKQVRNITETLVANYLNVENKWKNAENVDTTRFYRYGYGEFRDYKMKTLSELSEEEIVVYNEPIECACGCGSIIDGSDDDNDYLGSGFHHGCYEEREWCDYCDDYCSEAFDCCASRCEGCPHWDEAHPTCDLNGRDCLCPDFDYTSNGEMTSCAEHCSDCPYFNDKEEEE